MGSQVTPEHVRAFSEQGAVVIRGLLDAIDLSLLESGLGALIEAADDYSDYYDGGDLTTTAPKAGPRKRKTGQTLTRQNAWSISPEVRRLLQASPLAATAASVLRSREVRLYEDLMIYKARVMSSRRRGIRTTRSGP